MSLHKFAEQVASQGRGDDSLLVHMTPDEVRNLQRFAQANGTTLTINPTTGLPEAGLLSDLFKAVAPIALGAFLGPAGFGMSSMMAGLTTGGITTLATGSLSRGLMAGLGAYGGAGLADSLMTAGGNALVAGGAPVGAENLVGGLSSSGATAGSAVSVPPIEQINPSNFNLAKPDVLSAGAKAAMDNPMAFAKNNLGNLAYAAAPIAAGMMVPTTTQLPDPKDRFIRMMDYNINPDTGKPDPLYGMREMTPIKTSDFKGKTFQGQRDLFRQQNPNPYELGVGSLNQPPQQQPARMNTGGIVALAGGGDAALEAYQAGNYGEASRLLAEAGMNAQDVVSKYGLGQADAATVAKNLGYTGDMSGIQYAAPPVAQMANTDTANVQNQLTSIPDFSNTSSAPTEDSWAKNFWDAAPRKNTNILNYYDTNKNLFESKDYNKIASDMYVNEFTPEAFAQTMGWDQKAVADLYNKTYGGLDRATQENLVNQKYKKKLGLTDEQLGQRNFGAPMDTRENRLTSVPFSNAYEKYQEEMMLTGRRDAPEGTQFRAQAVFDPSAFGGRGAIKLYDTATGTHLTNISNLGYAHGLLDKFAVDPASYRQAASQMYEASGKPEYLKDDYAKSIGYKPRDVAAATDAYITKPLETATVADLRPKYETGANGRQTADSKINNTWLGSTQRLLMSKGMTDSEATDYLHQFIPVAGLVNWAEIHRSKDPVKAMMGTLNHLQSKGVINLDPNTGPFSKIGQTRLDASGKRLPALYTGTESLRSLGLKGFASGGIASLALGGDTKKALEDAYAAAQQSGNYGAVNDFVKTNRITAADVADTWQGFNTSGLAGLGVNLYTPPAAPTYTQYTDEQIGSYLSNPVNKDIDIGKAITATNADPAAVNRYIASLASPFVGSTDTKGGSGTLGIYNQMLAQGIDPNEYYAAAIANDPKYGGWTKEMIQEGYNLDKGAYALTAQIAKDKIAADPTLGYDKQWVKFMDDNKYSIDDAAQAFGLSRNEVTRRYNAVKDAEKKVITPITKITGGGTGTRTGVNTGVNTGVIPGGNYGRADGSTPGDITTNPDGTVTVHPNIPYRPDGGFSGMGEVRDAYTKGGGSLGYTAPVPKTAAEHNAMYNKLTDDSLDAYNYLMGKGKNLTQRKAETRDRPVMQRYDEAVLGRKMTRPVATTATTKKVVGVPGNPQSYFNEAEYLAANPDVANELKTGKSVSGQPTQFKSGYEHYLMYGKAGGRAFTGDYEGYLTAAALANAANAGGGGGGNTAGTTSNSVSMDSNVANSISGLAAPANPNIGDVNMSVDSPGTAAAAAAAAAGNTGSTTGTEGGSVASARGGLLPRGYAIGGGLGSLGSYSDGGRLLKGPGDGVSDSIPATIGAKNQPARLADGEFVIPARIVSELGNGSTDAGAKKLYAMMDRVQRARGKTTGKNKVAANSRADKYLPA
jgi:hypothetical protein